MTRVFLVLPVLVAVALPILQPQPSVVAITNVSVVPMDRETTLADQTIVVRGSSIAAIGPAAKVTVPEGATRIDGRGRFVIPALGEMHGHIPPGPPETNPDSAIENVLRLYVAGGIGTVRGMLGHPRHLALRDRAARGDIVSPIIVTSGPSLNANSVPTVDAAITAVKQQKEAGYDFLKIHPGITRDVFEALAKAADSSSIRFAGHVPVDLGLPRALELKYETIDHLDGYVEALAGKIGQPSQFFGVNMAAEIDESRIPDLVARTKAAGTWMVPTQVLIENVVGPIAIDELKKRPEIAKYAMPPQIEQWTNTKQQLAQKISAADRQRLIEVRRKLIRELYSAGVPFLLGSDAPQMWNIPGYSVHRELQVLVAAGLTPFQALQTGTVSVARFLKKDATSGAVATGKRADLVLLSGNPLKDITQTMNIAGVMIGGRYYTREELLK